MAKQKRKKTSGIFNKIKLTESYASLILGAIVVLIIGILFVFFTTVNRNFQTSSTKDVPKIQEENLQDSNTSSTYTIKPGDDLWTISENIYKYGFKWTEIAKINNLEDPGLIYAGNKLVLPAVNQEKQVTIDTQPSLKISDKVIQNNSITKSTYAVVKGDNLWDIAVRAYGDGFKWPEIARANKLINPNIIHPGNIFKIPR